MQKRCQAVSKGEIKSNHLLTDNRQIMKATQKHNRCRYNDNKQIKRENTIDAIRHTLDEEK